MLTLRQLVVAALAAQGCDGLYNEAGECSCLADDLAPCGHPNLDCAPGYRVPCDCGEHDFHVVTRADGAPGAE